MFSQNSTQFLPYRLALDMGTSSIGWAIINLDETGTPNNIIAMGVRKFNSGRADKTQEPLAAQRRVKRGMRRQKNRFKRRQSKLLNLLISLNLMPTEKMEKRLVTHCNHASFIAMAHNPYALRAQAIKQYLPHYALGRVLFALSQRRGYKSNRLEGGKKEGKPAGKIQGDIDGLTAAIQAGNFRTLGEYLAACIKENKPVLDSNGGNRRKGPRSNLQTTRKMYEDEFAVIKEKQGDHQGLTSENWKEIKSTIFSQRPLKTVECGKCELYGPQGLEGTEYQRAYAADPLNQKLRVWQDINNLKIIEHGVARHLNNAQRQALYKELSTKKSVSLSNKLKKLLNITQDATFNLNKAKSGEKLIGLETDISLSVSEAFGNKWFTLLPEDQTKIIKLLQTETDEEKCIKSLIENFDVSEIQAEYINNIKIESGTSRYCARAVQEILAKISCTCIESNTNRYMSVTEAVAELGSGYTTKQKIESDARLHYYAAMMAEVGMHNNSRTNPEERKFGVIGNPTVHIGLNQLRLVVNTIIDTYGLPQTVAIELARDLKMNKADKNELKSQQDANKKLRDTMIAECAKEGVSVNPDSRDDFLKYKLWHELDKDPLNRKCIYSGTTISLGMLMSGEKVQIEHILPRSRTLDDSPPNLTVAMRDANKAKGDQTPHEYWHEKPEYADILARIESLPKSKQWRFQENAMQKLQDEEGWLSSMLNDTRYLSKITQRYMLFICSDVQVSPGRLTAKARSQWFGKILEKDRDNDHRHHAVDALTVGLLDRRTIQQAQISAGSSDTHAYKRLKLPCPLPQ